MKSLETSDSIPPTALFACDICGKGFAGPGGWERRGRHMAERRCSRRSDERKESKGSSSKRTKSSSGNSVAVESHPYASSRPTNNANVIPRLKSIEDLFLEEDHILDCLRLNKDPQQQQVSKEALVSAVLECQDRELVTSVELTFHQYELWCIGRNVPQYPITGLKAGLFLADFLGRPPSRATLAARAIVPASQYNGLAVQPGQRLDLKALMDWLSILQSCATATSFVRTPHGQFVYSPHTAENLSSHRAVYCVMEEARNRDASEVLASLRKTRMVSLEVPGPAPRNAPPSVFQTPEPLQRHPPPFAPLATTLPRRQQAPVTPPIAAQVPVDIQSMPIDPFSFPTWPRDKPLPSPAQILASAAILWCPPPRPKVVESSSEIYTRLSQLPSNPGSPIVLPTRSNSLAPKLHPTKNTPMGSPNPLRLPSPAEGIGSERVQDGGVV